MPPKGSGPELIQSTSGERPGRGERVTRNELGITASYANMASLSKSATRYGSLRIANARFAAHQPQRTNAEDGMWTTTTLRVKSVASSAINVTYVSPESNAPALKNSWSTFGNGAPSKNRTGPGRTSGDL